MSPRPTPPDSVKSLMQAHGLAQPSAAFSAALPRLVVARYIPPREESFRASAWLGKAILLVLASLLVLATYAVPVAISPILAAALTASGLGIGSAIWLLEQHRKHQPEAGIA